MVWIGKREQVVVGLLFVVLLATGSAGRLAAAGDGMVWLANSPMGKVSVAGATQPEGPPQPTVDQVQAAMQQRIRGFELASIQSELEATGLKKQLLTLRGQVGEGAAMLVLAAQDLESVRDQLMTEHTVRENLSQELTNANRRVRSLTEQLRQTESQVVLLQTQLTPPTSAVLPVIHAEPGSAGRP